LPSQARTTAGLPIQPALIPLREMRARKGLQIGLWLALAQDGFPPSRHPSQIQHGNDRFSTGERAGVVTDPCVHEVHSRCSAAQDSENGRSSSSTTARFSPTATRRVSQSPERRPTR